MILVRDTFQVKFGQMDKIMEVLRAAEAAGENPLGLSRVLTDVSGNMFTLVVEVKVESLDQYRARLLASFGDPESQAQAGALMQHMEHGKREFFNIEWEA